MSRKLNLLCLATSVVILASCHKTNNATPGNSAQLVGNYKLLYLSANIQAINQESAAGQTQKTIAYNNYTTTNNGGTITFTKDSMAWKGLTYTADYTVYGYVYVNGTLTDSITFPFYESLAPVNATTKYEVFGQDSIHVQGGYPTSSLGATGSGSSAIAPPSGGRFSFKGDTLFITSKGFQSNPPQNISGVTVTSTASGTTVIAMVRQ
jgi:hypothetical protein